VTPKEDRGCRRRRGRTVHPVLACAGVKKAETLIPLGVALTDSKPGDQHIHQSVGSRYAERVIVVCDNLSTHTKGAFYENLACARARWLVRRIELCYTRKHGNWLNIAEGELSSLTVTTAQLRASWYR
jgi:hypothetical protein